MGNSITKHTHYLEWLKSLKQRFRQAQLKASVRINSALLGFYWELGADIVEKQKNVVWGSGFLKRLCTDLSTEFPDVAGFSYRNVKNIHQWYLFYVEGDAEGKQPVSLMSDETGTTKGKRLVSQIVPAGIKDRVSLLTQIPWGHNIRIVQKCDTVEQAFLYVCKTIENGWSRTVFIYNSSAYADVPGYCKSATLADMRKHDYVLTPGRYVGAAALEDDGIPFETKMTELSRPLYAQMEESAKRDVVIRKNLEVLEYGM